MAWTLQNAQVVILVTLNAGAYTMGVGGKGGGGGGGGLPASHFAFCVLLVGNKIKQAILPFSLLG